MAMLSHDTKQETIHYNFLSLLTNKHHGELNFFKAKGFSGRQEIPCPSQNLTVMFKGPSIHAYHQPNKSSPHLPLTTAFHLCAIVSGHLSTSGFLPKTLYAVTISHKHATPHDPPIIFSFI